MRTARRGLCSLGLPVERLLSSPVERGICMNCLWKGLCSRGLPVERLLSLPADRSVRTACGKAFVRVDCLWKGLCPFLQRGFRTNCLWGGLCSPGRLRKGLLSSHRHQMRLPIACRKAYVRTACGKAYVRKDACGRSYVLSSASDEVAIRLQKGLCANCLWKGLCSPGRLRKVLCPLIDIG